MKKLVICLLVASVSMLSLSTLTGCGKKTDKTKSPAAKTGDKTKTP